MLQYPNIDPVAISFGPMKVHWYGIMYLLGFAMAWLLGAWRSMRPNSGWTREQVTDMIFYCMFGVIIGGRLGYVLFYAFDRVLENPFFILEIWRGGMSFHGGFLGVAVAMWIFALKNKKTFFAVTDFLAPLVPLGLGAGRLGNFINAELWGRPTDLPWAMVFPGGGNIGRHPSQLYEFLLEGMVLFAILWWYSRKPRPAGATSALFIIFYGLFRFLVEWVREPDPQKGFIAFDWLTMGMVLSIPMVLVGLVIFHRAFKRKTFLFTRR